MNNKNGKGTDKKKKEKKKKKQKGGQQESKNKGLKISPNNYPL